MSNGNCAPLKWDINLCDIVSFLCGQCPFWPISCLCGRTHSKELLGHNWSTLVDAWKLHYVNGMPQIAWFMSSYLLCNRIDVISICPKMFQSIWLRPPPPFSTFIYRFRICSTQKCNWWMMGKYIDQRCVPSHFIICLNSSTWAGTGRLSVFFLLFSSFLIFISEILCKYNAISFSFFSLSSKCMRHFMQREWVMAMRTSLHCVHSIQMWTKCENN